VEKKRLESSNQRDKPLPSEAMQRANYLRGLSERFDLSAREIALLSQEFAKALKRPELAVSHQAVSNWLGGTRTPLPEHRELLRKIFNNQATRHPERLYVTSKDFKVGCDGPAARQLHLRLNLTSVLCPVTVSVFGKERNFGYSLTVGTDFDARNAAVYERWSDIFRPRPNRLMRHFAKLKHSLFGWIPHTTVRPLVNYACALLPLGTQRSKLQETDYPNKRIWFVHLPDGRVDVGTASCEGRWLSFSESLLAGEQSHRYPLSRVDLLGYLVDRPLFYMRPL